MVCPFDKSGSLNHTRTMTIDMHRRVFNRLVQQAALPTYRIDGSQWDLHEMDFHGADLREMDLRGADLSGSDLSRVNLHCVALMGANLRNVDFTWANLAGADLRGADLSGANMGMANLLHTDMTETILVKTHLCPPTMLLAHWGEVSPDLCAALMRYDAANHPDGIEAFTQWAVHQGFGPQCPYTGRHVSRAATFFEHRACWDPTTPLLSAFELMVRLIREKCVASDYHDAAK